MLPNDTKARKKALDEQRLKQTGINEHFRTVTVEEKPIQYTDEVWMEAALEWLIETGQVSCKVFFFKK
jgi:hypothetical protein